MDHADVGTTLNIDAEATLVLWDQSSWPEFFAPGVSLFVSPKLQTRTIANIDSSFMHVHEN